MNLPEPLEKLVEGYTWNKVAIGMSTAATYRLEADGHPTIYLKIDGKNQRRELSLSSEKDAMRWLAGKLPVPEVLFYGEVDGTGCLLMSALPGMNGIDAMSKMEHSQLARLLAQGLKMIHSVPINDCPLDWRLDKSITIAEFNLIHHLVHEEDFDAERRGRPAADLMEELRRLRPPEEDLVFTHGDYCVPNIIINEGKVSGFVDLSKAGIADRYQDIALGARSIRYNLGPGFEEIFLEEYGITEPDWKKIEYYKLLDEFF